MVAEIRTYLENAPFVPFLLRMADGREYRVPTRDHIYLPPKSGRVVITNDQGYVLTLPALLISGILVPPAEPEPKPKTRRPRPPGRGKR